MLKKFPSDEINGTNAHHSFTFNLRFLYELKHKIRLSKTVCEVFHFRFRFVCIKVLFFFFDKIHGLFDFKMSFQSENSIKVTHSFVSRPLIFKLQQEVLKFNDIYVSWSSPKTNLVTNFLSLENRSFENVSFCQ